MSFDISKTDPELGHKIADMLNERGIQTPTGTGKLYTSANTKIRLIEGYMRHILFDLGLDLNDDSLQDTPNRLAKMYVNELFWGLNPENFPKCTAVENKMKYDEMVCEKNISCISFCEHHFVTIDGFAHVAYIPNNKVLGLSKMNRIVEYFARRPQIQERLTEQVYHTLAYILETKNVAVVIDAAHFCVKSRGVEDSSSRTITSKMGGSFKDNPEQRAEFLALTRG